jgi:hypothetical protein
MPDPKHRPNVTLEELLRLKRAERPAEDFWARFDQELRAKQLAAIVDQRPWWRIRWIGPSKLARYSTSLAAAMSLGAALVAVREYFPTVPMVALVARPVAIPVATAQVAATPQLAGAPTVIVPAEPPATIADAPPPAAAPAGVSAGPIAPTPAPAPQLGLATKSSPLTEMVPTEFAIDAPSNISEAPPSSSVDAAFSADPAQFEYFVPSAGSDVYAFSPVIPMPDPAPAAAQPKGDDSDPVALVVGRLKDQDLRVHVPEYVEIASTNEGLELGHRF